MFSILTTNLVKFAASTRKDFNEYFNKPKILEHPNHDATRKMDAENHTEKMPKM
jgi:hypothetical protein